MKMSYYIGDDVYSPLGCHENQEFCTRKLTEVLQWVRVCINESRN